MGNGFKDFELTHELSENCEIRFLDFKLFLNNGRTCWMYQPRGNKPVLPFHSAHFKLVKRGIAKSCFMNALRKSCVHKITESFVEQSSRLTSAGYPDHVQVSVAEGLLRELKAKGTDNAVPPVTARQAFAVVPYMHKIAHNLKKVAQRVNVKVVFTAPQKLSRLCKLSVPPSRPTLGCTTKHANKFRDCICNVVYQLLLSCGRYYVGQTGRCINERLREHMYNVDHYKQGWLSVHCSTCGCRPIFSECSIVARCRDRTTREIIEAEKICSLKDACVSTPSVALTDKEKLFLCLSM